MKKVNIALLKSKLSEFLRAVKEGEEVVILDHNQPIAKIIAYENGELLKIRKRDSKWSVSKLIDSSSQSRKSISLKALLEERDE